jgi:hypothetical protein
MSTREHYEFANFKKWDAELNNAIKRFSSRYGLCPNILLASDETLEKINEVANSHSANNFYGAEGGKIKQKPKEEPSGVSLFSAASCMVEFCVDQQIPYTGFALVFDADADISDPQPPN